MDGVREILRELLVTDNDLSFVADMQPDAQQLLLSELQAYIARIDSAQQPLYKTMAAYTKFIPNFMLARLGKRLSPYIMAQVTNYLEPKPAASLAKLFDDGLLGEIAIHLSLQQAAAIAGRLGFKQLCAIIAVMRDRGFYRRVGEVADAIEPALMAKVIEHMDDPKGAARVISHMSDSAHVGRVARKLSKSSAQQISRHLSELESTHAGEF